MKQILQITLTLLAMAAPALAHSPLKETVPADNAKVSATPSAIKVMFKKPARMTKVMIYKTSGEGTGKERMAISTKGFANEHVLQPTMAGSGDFKVEWRALGQDGHVQSGAFSFTVNGN
ncbi:MAG: copper resistance CopC family protein [Pseudomonadota bacterium]